MISPDVTEGMDYGIDVRGDCEITGDGTLNVTSGQAADGSIGLYLTGTSVITDAKVNATADGDANVTATGNDGTLSYGIYSTKYVILNGGKTIAASTSTQDRSNGIDAFGIRIYGGELIAVSDGGNAVKTWWGSDVCLFPPTDKLIRVDTGEDEASPATTITMPAADATVTANWHTHS